MKAGVCWRSFVGFAEDMSLQFSSKAEESPRRQKVSTHDQEVTVELVQSVGFLRSQ